MPEAIGDYKILSPLGTSGLGDEYRARDTRVGRTVTLILLSPSISEDPDKFTALMNAARKVKQFSHPNIEALFESGQEGSQYYLVFEHVQGAARASRINGHAFNARRGVELVIQLADALAEADNA